MNQIQGQLLRWAESHPMWTSASLHGLALAGALAIWAGPEIALTGRSGEAVIRLAEREPTWAEPIPPQPAEAEVEAPQTEPQWIESELASADTTPDPSFEPWREAFTPWGGPGADLRARAMDGKSTELTEAETAPADVELVPPSPSPEITAEASDQPAQEEQEVAAEATVRIEGDDPVYPLLSIRFGEEGDVVCRLSLDSQGRVIGIQILESSGHARLDAAAREALMKWRFGLAQEQEQASQVLPAEVDHTVQFRLRDA